MRDNGDDMRSNFLTFKNETMIDYHKKLIRDRIDELNYYMSRNDITVQSPEENKEELSQLTKALENYSVISGITDCALWQYLKKKLKSLDDDNYTARNIYDYIRRHYQ